MPYYEDRPFGGFKDGTTQERLRIERETDGVVFSAYNSFNPTNLAVKKSLQDIFDSLEPMITGHFLTMNLEEDDEQQPFESS